MTVHWQEHGTNGTALATRGLSGSRSLDMRTVGRGTRITWRHACLILLLVWSLALASIFGHGNDFPASWHPDEPAKVAQVLGAPPNFHHPELLLMATRLALVFQAHPTPESVVVAGRWVSATAAAAAVGALALSALLLYGEVAALLTALLVGTNPLLFGLAHYMKEDPVYVFGLCVFLLTCVRYDRRPSAGRLAQMALAAGLAMSGKYIGIIAPIIALGIIAWRNRGNASATLRRSAVVVGLSLAVFIAVDAQLLESFYRFFFGLRQEMKHVIDNSGGLYYPLSSPFYLEGLLQICSPLIIIIYGWMAFRIVRSRGRSGVAKLVIGLLPVAYLAMLQLSPVKAVRYELPVAMIVATLAACGFALLLARRRSPAVRLVAALAVMIVLAGQLAGIAAARKAMLNDTRGQMAEWIKGNLSPGAVLAEGRYSGMTEEFAQPTLPNEVTVKVLTGYYTAAELGSLDDLRAAGVTHVLIADTGFGRYFNPMVRIDEKDPYWAPRVANVHAFHVALFETARLVHQIPSAAPVGTYFSPGLWLFDIRTQKAAGRDSGVPAETPTIRLLQD